MIDMRKREKTIYQACDRLVKEGIDPSVRRLRDRVGGSTDAIAQHLRSWRERQPTVSDADPDANPVQIATSNLFDQMISEAQGILAANEAERDKALKDAAEHLDAAKAKLAMAADTLRDQIEQGEALQSENDNLRNALAQSSEQLAVNRAQIDNGALERDRLIAELAAAKNDTQALHKKLDDARETSTAKQQDMEIDLADVRNRATDLEHTLADAQNHHQHLETAALRASEENRKQMQVIQGAHETIDTLQADALRQAHASSTKDRENARLQNANEQWQGRCAQLETTIEDLGMQLEEQAQADALSSMKQLEALAEQVSLLTKKLGATQEEKECAVPDKSRNT